jgi:CheY-like chemotaxis protein
LIVDDDAKIRDFLRSVLEAQGYLVQETSDGREALSKIAQNCPDVVLTDIVMPDVEGIELIRMIRKVTPNLRIIAMSGASDGYLHAARALGADATIQKPIDIDALLALMLTLFSPHSARQTDQRDLDRSPAAI